MNDWMKTPETNNRSGNYGIAPRRHRLPAETQLGAVRLQVADVERSVNYYGRVLGLRLMSCEDGITLLAAQEADRPLIILTESPGAAPVPRRGHLGLYHFAILLPTRADLGRFLRHLTAIGEEAAASDHLVSEALYLRDPDGLGIEVYADRPRSAWEASNRELRMTTVPLNTTLLLRHAGYSGWNGMPAEATVGHVHLRVGDLDRAAAFYHDGLGLDKTVWSYPGALFLSAGGYHHHLGLNTWAAGALAAGETDARLLEWTLELAKDLDVADTATNLEAAGYPVERSAIGQMLTRDPWGTCLRVRALQTDSVQPHQRK